MGRVIDVEVQSIVQDLFQTVDNKGNIHMWFEMLEEKNPEAKKECSSERKLED